MYDGSGRVELSGATVANWVAKTANLLVDECGRPPRVGVLLPLHWQAPVAVLATVATGATVVLAVGVDDLAGCDVAFVDVDRAAAALPVAGEVLVVSLHPLGLPLGAVPASALDLAREVPGQGDHFPGATSAPLVELGGQPVLLEGSGLGADDRVLTAMPLAAAPGIALLGPLHAGASMVLIPQPGKVDLAAIAQAEQVTATAGCQLPGLRQLV